MTAGSPTISIIVPVLNEEPSLPDSLQGLQRYRQQGHEVVVVDGGSHDNSLMLAQQAADQVIVSRPGRAHQMNSGAQIASGDVLLFLHADTRLPDNALALIQSVCEAGHHWGRFDVKLSGHRPVFRIIESLINLRSRLSGIATGDQAIFIQAQLFHRLGGFPEIPLMEDVALSRLLRRQARPVCLKPAVITSSRRWEQNGVVSTVLLMWKLRLLYFLGVSPARLSRMYR